MSLLASALGLSLLGSLGCLLVASLLLAFNESVRTRLVPWLISYAVGALLGASLLGLLPEALAEIPPQAVLGSLLAGIVVFFMLEKLVLLRHCHTDDCHVHGTAAPLVIIGARRELDQLILRRHGVHGVEFSQHVIRQLRNLQQLVDQRAA